MGCKCGSQIILCNLPVRFDTYRGCSHGCRYCFAQKKNDISHIERDESVDGLRSFIEGKRGNETEWCDWNIPIHWGGMSDPFQPVEKQIRASYESAWQRRTRARHRPRRSSLLSVWQRLAGRFFMFRPARSPVPRRA